MLPGVSDITDLSDAPAILSWSATRTKDWVSVIYKLPITSKTLPPAILPITAKAFDTETDLYLSELAGEASI